MSTSTLPGYGDPQTWGPYTGHPNDPRDPGETTCAYCRGDCPIPEDSEDTPDCGGCCQQCGSHAGVHQPLPGDDRLCALCGDVPGADERGEAA